MPINIARALKNVAKPSHRAKQRGLSTKINATVEVLGNPIGFALTPGLDLDGADVLLPRVEAQTVLADKGYDADDRVITPLCRQERPWSFRPNVTATSSVITIKNLAINLDSGLLKGWLAPPALA